MSDLEKVISGYVNELEERLIQIQRVQRENYVEEIRDHLYSFVNEYKQKGLSDVQIEQKIQEEFLSMNELAADLINSSKRSRFNIKHNYILLLPILVGALGIFVFPDYQELLIALMLFIYSYLVLIQKAIWGFAVIRKKPGRIKHQEKVAQIGSIYLFILGLFFIMGQFVTVPNKEVIFFMAILLVTFGFYFYTNRKLLR
ncbi:hypothetical protein [Fictibacillus barbaricus]|uniref:DUF1129 domain-containing protein n=1 Tax=Fictibacillus barbaricus TaxID=182136 RepID=A0ABS2ZE11_9BACL|nr:hypothetical protein [Fictibacillus barbaricus]MBN3544940.1 hypothetical protein [Fictibacillus barbaricus]GGB62931.1 hypothetical protein GCM10007199_31150 [Fictibacillus barbaricus]